MVIVLPVFNDWEAVRLLIPLLDAALVGVDENARILIVSDGSTTDAPPNLVDRSLPSFKSISILHLRRNLGHQRAIGIGLMHLYQHEPPECIVIMDADGEDRPEDVPRLLTEYAVHNGMKVVFAARTKRLESVIFRCFYQVYRFLHLVLTGIAVRVGNFSAVPPRALASLTVVSDLWNHYSAAVFRARIPFVTIPTERGVRLAGESRMNFVALVVHGLSAISVFSDVVSARLLTLISAASGITALLATVSIAIRFSTHAALPEWAGLLAVVLVQALLTSVVLVFTIIGGRSNLGFIPIRDAHHFIGREEKIYPKT